MASDPAPPPGKLEEGERVLAFLRRKRLENVVMLPFAAGVALFLASTFLAWPRNATMGIFAVVILAAVPVGVLVNTQWWLTDRRVLRKVALAWSSFPLDGVVAARVAKGRVGDDLHLDDASGTPVVVVRSVDNAAEAVQAYATRGDAPAAPAEGDAPAAPAEGASS